MPLYPGDIVHLYVQSLTNPKNKFGIIVCVDPKILLLLITSGLTDLHKISPNLESATRLFWQQNTHF
jgi:hypothetical protein